MTDIEIPLGKRTKLYRAFEILPGAVSIAAVVLLIVLFFVSPLWASIYVLVIVSITFIRSLMLAYRTIQGRIVYAQSRNVDWAGWLGELEDPAQYAEKRAGDLHSRQYGLHQHVINLQEISRLPEQYPKPSELYHAVVICLVDESYDTLGPTLQSLLDNDYDPKRLIVAIAYEERAAEISKETRRQIKKNFTGKFFDLLFYGHPANLPDEVIGKGPNLTNAGRQLTHYLEEKQIAPRNVIMTELDSDNRPEPKYFSYLSYAWITTPDRQQVSFQPICLFTNNIWDAPAPMRVIATSNSLWNMILSQRTYALRNAASHAQGMEALIGMDFLSTRTIVEDAHQFWRSYLYFNGHYRMISLRISIGQDVVLSRTYGRTLCSQFIQTRRWAYSAADIAFVASHLFSRDRTVRFWPLFARWMRLVNNTFTWAAIPVVIALGGCLPWLLSATALHSLRILQVPQAITLVSRVATIGLIVTMLTALTLLPPRPDRYPKSYSLTMLLQWILLPVTTLVYLSLGAYNAQIHLMLGKYLGHFKVTEKYVKK